MSEYVWTPPGLTEAQAIDFFDKRRGIPQNAKPQVVRWLMDDEYDHQLVSTKWYLKFQTSLRRNVGLTSDKHIQGKNLRRWLDSLPDDDLLAMVDFKLSELYPRPSFRPSPPPPVGERMQSILAATGSSWTVGDRNDRWGLVEALPDGVVEVAEGVVSQASLASPLLKNAWSNAFGVDPHPSAAYADAIKAVEIFSCPLISPKDKVSTLGKDIAVLKNKPTAWRFALAGDQAVERVVSTMQLLWQGQQDRHGGKDYQDVTIEQAQAAVLLATTLVGWFSQGLLQRAE